VCHESSEQSSLEAVGLTYCYAFRVVHADIELGVTFGLNVWKSRIYMYLSF